MNSPECRTIRLLIFREVKIFWALKQMSYAFSLSLILQVKLKCKASTVRLHESKVSIDLNQFLTQTQHLFCTNYMCTLRNEISITVIVVTQKHLFDILLFWSGYDIAYQCREASSIICVSASSNLSLPAKCIRLWGDNDRIFLDKIFQVEKKS